MRAIETAIDNTVNVLQKLTPHEALSVLRIVGNDIVSAMIADETKAIRSDLGLQDSRNDVQP